MAGDAKLDGALAQIYGRPNVGIASNDPNDDLIFNYNGAALWKKGAQGGGAQVGGDQLMKLDTDGSLWMGSTPRKVIDDGRLRPLRLDPGLTESPRRDIMATQWTNPVGPGSRILVFDVTELRNAIDCSRSAYGAPPYSWTDPTLTPEQTRIKAVHLTEMRTAIQELWNQKAMGTLPAWTGGTPTTGGRILASHLTDLRTWLNQYETNTTGAVYNPLRGLHLRNAADMRPADVTAARTFAPKMVVVLSSDVLRPGTLNYLKELKAGDPSVEIFVRYWPTTYPPLTYTTFEGYNSWQSIYGGGAAVERAGDVVAQDIVDLYDSLLSNGLQVTRFYPGNEPETEWLSPQNSDYTWGAHTWEDIKYYYRDVYYWLRQKKGTRPIELYPPAFAQFSFLGKSNYWPDGTTKPKTLDDGTVGADHVRDVIEYYTNDSPDVGRVNWHSYFWPGRQAEQSAYNFMPQWLKDDINAGYPARITEFGWHPDCFDPPPGCNANLDTTTSPCGGTPKSLTSWGDYNDFVRNRSGAGGAAVWLLSSPTQDWWPWCAFVSDGTEMRLWFRHYVCFLNANI
ncbi:MAG: hypothetical protein HYU86_10960 [Chloroflexi bacterium]|nr:hypothetical protein [Chloroflexota bacterium]